MATKQQAEATATAAAHAVINDDQVECKLEAVEKRLNLLIASWNVGNAMPPTNNSILQGWIPQGGGEFDIIAVGLQESNYKEHNHNETEDQPVVDQESDEEADKQPVAATESDPAFSISSSTRQVRGQHEHKSVMELVRDMSEKVLTNDDYPFINQLAEHIGSEFELVSKAELMEMRLAVFVNIKHAVTSIERVTVATGIGNVLGNKGGCVVKLELCGTSLCFLSCHLAAHQAQKFLDKRNMDSASILSAPVGLKHVGCEFQYDHCFFFGDLNYRIDLQYGQGTSLLPPDPQQQQNVEQISTTSKGKAHHQLHFERVCHHIQKKEWEFLNTHDQLKHQVDEQKALTGWQVAPAIFPPTFKRIRHTLDQYNKQRVPSYCDRVLYKSLPARAADLLLKKFDCVQEIATSDHKPVCAHFEITPTRNIESLHKQLSTRQCTIVELTELRATNLLPMDLNGSSDPYIKFFSVPPDALKPGANGNPPTTSTIMNTLSPTWNPKQIPRLYFCCDQEQDVRQLHLGFLLMDYDKTSQDDLMGVAVVTLDSLMSCDSDDDNANANANANANTNKTADTPESKATAMKHHGIAFETQVVLHGKPAGKLSGRVRVLLPTARDRGNTHRTTIDSNQVFANCMCEIS